MYVQQCEIMLSLANRDYRIKTRLYLIDKDLFGAKPIQFDYVDKKNILKKFKMKSLPSLLSTGTETDKVIKLIHVLHVSEYTCIYIALGKVINQFFVPYHLHVYF